MHTRRKPVRLGGNHESSRFSHNQRDRGPYYSHRCVFSTLRAGFYDDHKLVLFDCVNYGIHDSSYFEDCARHKIHTAREICRYNHRKCVHTPDSERYTAIRFTRVTSRPLRRQRISLTSPGPLTRRSCVTSRPPLHPDPTLYSDRARLHQPASP